MLDWGRSQDVMAATPNCKYSGFCIPKVSFSQRFAFLWLRPPQNFVCTCMASSKFCAAKYTCLHQIAYPAITQFPYHPIVSLHPYLSSTWCPSTYTATSIRLSFLTPSILIHYFHTQTSRCLQWHCIIIQRACSHGTLRLTSTVLAFYISLSTSNLKGKSRLKL